MSLTHSVNLRLLVSNTVVEAPELKDILWDIGRRRDVVNASNTRSAGSNLGFHIDGAWGEGLVRHLLGIKELPECLTTWSREPDILIVPQKINGNWYNGIEVKKGQPVEGKKKVRPDCIYVVIGHAKPLTVTHVCLGREILELAQEPVGHAGWREGSQKLNWVIPNTDPFK